MYKSIKISGEAYKKAKTLSRELENSGELTGVEKVNMSVAVGYALSKALEGMRKKNKFISAAGGWKDLENADELLADIHSSRKNTAREPKL